MVPRFRLAVFAAILALLISAAVVPFVHDWHHIERTVRIVDPERPGRFKQIAIFFPIYWFYVAAAVGSFLASLIALRSAETVRVPSLIFFLLLCDFFYAWIGGVAYMLHLYMLAPDDNVISTLRDPDAPSRASKWAELPLTGLIGGVVFGNIATRGFGFLIGLPTIICLALRRRLVRIIGQVRQ